MSIRSFRHTGLCALLLASACASKDVVLFFDFDAAGAAGAAGTGGSGGSGTGGTGDVAGSPTLLEGGDDTESGAAGTTGGQSEVGEQASPIVCASNDDCPEASVCEKATCEASTGTCIPQPICFDVTPNPVCGCDGVTYWNDCLRKQVGPPASTPSECAAGAARCWDNTDCGNSHAVCGHLVASGDPCGPGPGGGRGGPAPNQQGMQPGPLGTCWVIPDSCDPSVDPMRWNGCGNQQADACVDTCSALRSGWPHVKSASGVCP